MKASYKIALIIAMLLCGMVIVYYINQDGGTEQTPVPAEGSADTATRPSLTSSKYSKPPKSATPTSAHTQRTTPTYSSTRNHISSPTEQQHRSIDAARTMLNQNRPSPPATPPSATPAATSPPVVRPLPPGQTALSNGVAQPPSPSSRTPGAVQADMQKPVIRQAPIDRSVPQIVLDGQSSEHSAATTPSSASPITPPPPVPARKTPRQSMYTVVEGDTFSSIAIKLYGDDKYWVDIAQANPLVDPIRLRVGQELKLPSEDDLREISSTDSLTSDDDRPQRYTVRAGDTLSTIAVKFYNDSSRWRDIFNANRDQLGGNPDRIQAGITITIPDI